MIETRTTEPIVALDVASRPEAERLLTALGPSCGFVKCGLELFTREGPEVVRWLRDREVRVFLDLKLHDIPTTVARAVASVRDLGVDLLTVHAGGGRAMLEAAQAEAGAVGLLGVTVLTSLDGTQLAEAWGREEGAIDVSNEVVRLAGLTREAGLAGVVASVAEARVLRAALGPAPLIVTPGIRFAGGDAHDQARVATPGEAASAGASHIVIGRAVTAAPEPAVALERAIRELSEVTR